jgi:hypothetical protein
MSDWLIRLITWSVSGLAAAIVLFLMFAMASTLDIVTGEKHVIATGVIDDRTAHFWRPESNSEYYVSVLSDGDSTTHILGRMSPKEWHECKVGDRATVYQYRGRIFHGQWFAEADK